MADVRLIDANALTKFFEEIAPIPLIPIINGFIEERTTIDAVPVVRCVECKYYDYGKRFPDMKWCCRLRDKNGEVVRYPYGDDDYCSYGERREVDDNG